MAGQTYSSYYRFVPVNTNINNFDLQCCQNADKYRVMAIDSGGGGEEENLVVSQQEVVSTASFFGNGQVEKMHSSPRKSLQIQNSLHIVKSDVVESHQPQLSLDPLQVALNSVGGEGGIGDLSEMETAQDEAMKLLASHGITMVSVQV